MPTYKLRRGGEENVVSLGTTVRAIGAPSASREDGAAAIPVFSCSPPPHFPQHCPSSPR